MCSLHIPSLVIASVAGLVACAPSHYTYEEYRLIYDLDYDVVMRLDEARVTVPDIPHLDDGEDCNENRIEDSFDYAGYVPRGPYPVGEGPEYVAAGMTSGGPRQDLVVLNSHAGTVSVLNQRHDRRFADGVEHAVGSEPACIGVADIDGDALPDIVVGHESGPETVTVLHNLPGGGFARDEYPVSTDAFLQRSPRCVAIANLDGGALDVIASSGEAPGNKVLTLFSNGTFDLPQHHEVPLVGPGALVTGDFDADGAVDVCAIATTGARVSCAENALDRPIPQPFSDWEHWTFATGVSPVALAAGDLDNDGLLDLAIAGEDSVTLLRNTGRGWGRECVEYDDEGECERWVGITFAVPERLELGGQTRALSIADLDDDGDNDIAVTLPEDNIVAFLANSSGTFADARGRPRVVELPVRSAPSGILARDIDNDGRIEVVVTNRGSDDIWVLHRRDQPINMMLDCLPMMQAPPRETP